MDDTGEEDGVNRADDDDVAADGTGDEVDVPPCR